MSPIRLLTAMAVLVLVGCGTTTPSPSAAVALPDPGRPYDGDALLDAMRDSRRPGGVPMELQDGDLAAEVADRLWTFDGEPWTALAAGGSCGPSTCTLELSGGRADAGGGDAWVFTIDPATASVEVLSADLQAVPDETAAALDRWARAMDAEGVLDGLRYTAVRWLPPPAEDRFRLAYRSGDEEESCSIDLELDAATGRITEVVPSGC